MIADEALAVCSAEGSNDRTDHVDFDRKALISDGESEELCLIDCFTCIVEDVKSRQSRAGAFRSIFIVLDTRSVGGVDC